MRIFERLVLIAVLFLGVAITGINWTAVWLEPRTSLLTLTVGELRPYTVMGLSGANTKADLTKSPHLKITSSDTKVVEIDRDRRMFIPKTPGRAEVSIAFSEAKETVQVIVKAQNAGSAPERSAK